jgi:hypothetical protein
MEEQTSFIKNKTVNGTKVDNTKIITLGKYWMQADSNIFWTHSTNPSYAMLKPYWLAFLSAGFLTAQ